ALPSCPILLIVFHNRDGNQPPYRVVFVIFLLSLYFSFLTIAVQQVISRIKCRLQNKAKHNYLYSTALPILAYIHNKKESRLPQCNLLSQPAKVLNDYIAR